MLQIQNNPWLGLASYQEKDADLFFGREKEIAFLCEVIKQNYSTVIYGKSGMGKTSLINAGLIPLLNNDGFLPVLIKLEHNGDRSYTNQIIEAVIRKLEEQGCEIEKDTDWEAIVPDEYKLWSFFHTNIFWSKDNHRVIPMVFIDQFEEIFTICTDKSEALGFFSLLNDLFQPLPPDEILNLIEENNVRIDFNETTNFRLILALREDFLARLEDYSYHIPVLKKNRVGVSPMSGIQALEVILRPIPDIMNREAALKILEKVSKCLHIEDDEEALKEISIETCILSLFCSQLYKKAVELKKDTITSEMIEKFGDNIINDYYHECMKQVSKDSVMYLEDKLLTSSGYRNSLAYEDVVPKYVLKKEIEHLEKCRLVRIEILNKTERIEFTHDVLCGVALEHKTQRKRSNERSGKVKTVIGHVIDYALMFSFVFMLFWGVDDPFRSIMNDPFRGFINNRMDSFVIAILLLPISMLMRLTVYTTDRRSAWYSIVMFVLSYIGGFFACNLLDGIRCEEEYWIPWCLTYFLYTFIILIISLTKSRAGSLMKLVKSAFLIRDTSPLALKSLKIFVAVCYLLFVAVSGTYMRTPLTIAMIAGIVPVGLMVTSVWKNDLFKNKNVWVCGLALFGLSFGLYASQFTHYRFWTYFFVTLLLVVTFWGISSMVAMKRVVSKCLVTVSVWLVCFIVLPTFIIGYNFWSLGDYAFVKDGLIVHLDDKVENRYVVLEDAEGKQGAFNRGLQVLVPTRYKYMGSESRYNYKWVGDMKVMDIRFPVNSGNDSVFISDCLAYKNEFSKQVLQCYVKIVETDVHGMIKKTACSNTEESGAKVESSSQNEGTIRYRLDSLCENKHMLAALYPDIYWKMAKYYHAKDSVNRETTMLTKALYYSITRDSTERFLAKGNWKAGREDIISSLASAMVYAETGHWYSKYVDKYDSCFLADRPYQQFIKKLTSDFDPQTFLSEVIDSGEYDNLVTNVLHNQWDGVSLRNPYFNGYMKNVYDRLGEWLNKSYVLIFMGEYEEAKQMSLLAMDSLTVNRALASTNLLTARLFLGEYEDVYKQLDAYQDTVIFNGSFKFYRDWILDDLNVFERAGIIDDIPNEEYQKIRNYIDPHGDRNYSTVAKSNQYGVYWAATTPKVSLWLWWFPFGFGWDGTVCLLDEHGNRITPEFDDVHIAHRDLLDDISWIFDPIVIYKLNGKRGYYNVSTCRFITDAEFNRAWQFSEGLAAVVKYNKEEFVSQVGFINEAGEIVIPFQYEYVAGHDYIFRDGVAFIPDRWGSGGEIIDKRGEVVDVWDNSDSD